MNNYIKQILDNLSFASYKPITANNAENNTNNLHMNNDRPLQLNNTFNPYNFTGKFIKPNEIPTAEEEPEENVSVPFKPEPVKPNRKYKDTENFRNFNKYYDEVEKEDPEAKKYRKFLTAIADHESKFNSSVQNSAGAPAYGYFQFMEDGNRWTNISKYGGTDIDTFRNDPKLQIKAAIKLAKAFESRYNDTDRGIAKQLGIDDSALLGGAWLAGVGGVRQYLYNNKDLSDKGWYNNGGGSSVSESLKRYSNLF